MSDTEKRTDGPREDFLDAVRQIVDWWSVHGDTEREKLEGVAFSLMVVLDGQSESFPYQMKMRVRNVEENEPGPWVDLHGDGLLHDALWRKE
jgi:hypothetical protein